MITPRPQVLAIVASALIVLALSSGVSADGKLSSRHSFNAPYNRVVSNWNYGAGAYTNDTHVRLTPAKQSRTGFIWNTIAASMSDWMVEVDFTVTGLRSIGGDGFAIWYVEKSEMLGTVYGSTDYWTGVGIFFDTFNNDNIGSSPLISAVYNDGTQKFDASSDGASQALATCSFDFRNLAQPASARIRYEGRTLTVSVAISRSTEGVPFYQPCLTAKDLELGVDKYFGVTAHTGDVADNHDVYSFNCYDLTPTDVDLAGIRAHYEQTLIEQHAQPAHQNLDAQGFQHSVMTLLSQMSEEINLIQMSQLSLSEFIFNGGTMNGMIGSAGIRPGGVEPPAPPVTGNVGAQLLTISSAVDNSLNQITALSDNNQNILREVRSLQAAINAMGGRPQLPGSPSLQQGNIPPSPSSADSIVLKSVQETLNAIIKRCDDLSQSIQKVKDEQIKSATTMSSTIQQLQSVASIIQTSANSLSSGGGLGGGGGAVAGGLGWSAYLMILISTLCIAALTLYTVQQHMKNQRYKLI